MNFGEALQALKDGKKVTRSIWSGHWEYLEDSLLIYESSQERTGRFKNGFILAHLKDGSIAPAQPYQNDILAEDWQIVE